MSILHTGLLHNVLFKIKCVSALLGSTYTKKNFGSI